MRKLTTGMIPEQHGLSSSKLIEFLKIYIPTDSDPLVQRLCLSETLEWDDNTWTKSAFSLSGLGQIGGEERVRPKLVLPNPEGIYSYYVSNQFLEGSAITYYQVHPDDLNSPQAQITELYVNRVMEVNRQYINLQLSLPSDGNSYKLPSRRFTQPEFRQVRI